ncbi:MAG: HK97 gp10 family phage protein [Anaerolineae bacterium]|jgi:HK97 gp10 family phage protein|nr:HK97 gp10 family phage protein [Anaerolineae bacterium]
MYIKLTTNNTPIQTIRNRASAYPKHLADDMVRVLNTQFGAVSPAPIGAPPARKSGALARSIVAVRVDAYRWRVVVGADYARFLEFGTKRMRARPFFLRGFEAVKMNPPKLG